MPFNEDKNKRIWLAYTKPVGRFSFIWKILLNKDSYSVTITKHRHTFMWICPELQLGVLQIWTPQNITPSKQQPNSHSEGISNTCSRVSRLFAEFAAQKSQHLLACMQSPVTHGPWMLPRIISVLKTGEMSQVVGWLFTDKYAAKFHNTKSRFRLDH